MAIIWLLFIGIVLHLATILLSRLGNSQDGSNGSDAVVSYLAPIVVMGFNIIKVFILFSIILIVINRF